ncbi:hypothetical protein ACE1ET_15130 [Saccharicrinis sp. FJH62]|uniref:hypothetical protein n=1 Tax=Saccharicrinis sp. FJH62 TaxID=3344657 RepID=UPI0035D4EC85
MKTSSIILVALIILGVSGCQKHEMDQSSSKDLTQLFVKAEPNTLNLNHLKSVKLNSIITSINEAISEHGIMVEKIETYAAEQEGMTLFFKDVGNKQLQSCFVPNDLRNGTGSEVPYVIDGTEMGTSSGMSETETINAIISAMNTWDNNTCSYGLQIPFLGTTDFDLGYVQFILGLGGFPGYLTGGVVHGGILPRDLFDAIQTNGGDFILGVTFTFIWTDDGGEPTDIDNNGKNDVAFKEIYINDEFNWMDAPDDVIGNDIYDFETVVLHETGHALCQAHFGKAFAAADGTIHFAPYALMNSGYSIANREITGTDLAGHCSIWSSWPW